jgi:hypothetical protein
MRRNHPAKNWGRDFQTEGRKYIKASWKELILLRNKGAGVAVHGECDEAYLGSDV